MFCFVFCFFAAVPNVVFIILSLLWTCSLLIDNFGLTIEEYSFIGKWERKVQATRKMHHQSHFVSSSRLMPKRRAFDALYHSFHFYFHSVLTTDENATSTLCFINFLRCNSFTCVCFCSAWCISRWHSLWHIHSAEHPILDDCSPRSLLIYIVCRICLLLYTNVLGLKNIFHERVHITQMV